MTQTTSAIALEVGDRKNFTYPQVKNRYTREEVYVFCAEAGLIAHVLGDGETVERINYLITDAETDEQVYVGSTYCRSTVTKAMLACVAFVKKRDATGSDRLESTPTQSSSNDAITPNHNDRKSFTDPLTVSDRAIIAQVLTWDLYREVSPDEIVTIGITHDILWVRLTNDRSVPIAVHTFKNIRRQQLEQQAQQQADVEVALVMATETKLQAVAEQEPLIEVDRSDGGVYRVWSGFHLIGIFYECHTYWMAEPVEGKPRRCRNAEAATKVVVHTYHHGNTSRLGAAA